MTRQPDLREIHALRHTLRQHPRLHEYEDGGRRPSAVLVLLFAGQDGQPSILLTKRATHLAHHQGEVCFIGGAADPEDESLLHTALREAREEMGIEPQDVEVLGALDPEWPRTSPFIIQPFVGLLTAPTPFQPSDAEIAEVLPVPLATLQDPASFREEAWLRHDDLERERYYAFGPHLIWGATARILRQLLTALRGGALVAGGTDGR